MLLLLTIVALLGTAFFSYAAFLRHRDAVARRAWETYCNEQAIANDAARAARRAGLRVE
jgi:hypothetical protein